MAAPRRERLTDQALTKRQPPAEGSEEIADEVVRGLFVRVTAAGTKTFVCRVMADGVRRRHKLGRYPEMSLAVARAKALAALDGLRDGRDLNAEAAAKRAEAERRRSLATLTLADLIATRGEARAEAAGWPEERRKLVKAYAAQLDRPLTAIAVDDLRAAIAKVRKRAPVEAARAARYLRTLVRWGRRESTPETPWRAALEHLDLDDLGLVVGERPRERVLSDDEIRAFWTATADGASRSRLYRTLLLSAQRRGEVAAMRRSQLDRSAEIWTVPRTKTAGRHVLPLTPGLVALIEAPSPGDLVFPNSTGGELGNWGRSHETVLRRSGTAGWTIHDLRRTAQTLMERSGVAPHVVDHVAGHAEASRVRRAYRHHDYLVEKRVALEALARLVGEIVGESSAKRRALVVK